MGPYDGVEPDDVEDPSFDPADYWDNVTTPDDDPPEDDDDE
jgi:hypothetical protein